MWPTLTTLGRISPHTWRNSAEIGQTSQRLVNFGTSRSHLGPNQPVLLEFGPNPSNLGHTLAQAAEGQLLMISGATFRQLRSSPGSLGVSVGKSWRAIVRPLSGIFFISADPGLSIDAAITGSSCPSPERGGRPMCAWYCVGGIAAPRQWQPRSS